MIENLLKRIAHSLDKGNIPYMIIGGQAVLLYGTPRMTRDIDITLGADVDEYTSIRKICEKSKLGLLVSHPEEFVKKTKVLPAEDLQLRIRVDFIFSCSPYERNAIKRAKKVKVKGYSVNFASAEDIVIHKMIAARAIDEEDVRNILIKNKGKIDARYIRRHLLEFNSLAEQKGIAAKFNKLMKEVTGYDTTGENRGRFKERA